MISRSVYLGISMCRRRARRRLVVGYWTAVVLMLALGAVTAHQRPGLFDPWWVPLLIGGFLGTATVFLGGSARLGPLPDFDSDPTPPPAWVPLQVANRILSRGAGNGDFSIASLDERDFRLRDRAHYSAYRFLRQWLIWALISAYVLFQYIYPHHEFLAIPVYALLILVVFNLPQSLILWTEPDMEEDN